MDDRVLLKRRSAHSDPDLDKNLNTSGLEDNDSEVHNDLEFESLVKAGRTAESTPTREERK